MVVSFFGLIAVAIVSQRTLVGASLVAHAAVVVPGPSQFYAQHNIVSDIPGLADHTDSNVVNAWGLDAGPATPWWIADNGSGKTTLLKLLNGELEPSSGIRHVHRNLAVGYFTQHHVDQVSFLLCSF